MSRGSERVCSVSTPSPPPAPMDNSPKPYRFKILNSETFGNYRILRIKYLDAINYEGNKILVYENPQLLIQHINEKYLDPHFIEGYYSPIARFEPTKKGWKMAVKFVRAMSGL